MVSDKQVSELIFWTVVITCGLVLVLLGTKLVEQDKENEAQEIQNQYNLIGQESRLCNNNCLINSDELESCFNVCTENLERQLKEVQIR